MNTTVDRSLFPDFHVGPGLPPAPGSWTVAQCNSPAGTSLMHVAFDEFDRLRNWLVWQLRPFELAAGQPVLLIASTGTLWPFASLQQALLDSTMLPVHAEQSVFDWYRTAAMLRDFKFASVLNLNASILAELEKNAPQAVDRLRHVPVVFAEPEAKSRLAKLGIVAHAMLNLGPTLAVECPRRLGLHVDGREWHVDAVEGQVHLSSVLPRLHRFDGFATGFRAHVEAAACACGSPDWRILPTAG